MPLNSDCVGTRYQGAPQLVDRDRHRAYAEAVGAMPRPGGDFSRPLACFAAVYLLWPVVPQLFEDHEVGLDVEHLLHGEQEFSFERPISFGDMIRPEGVIAQVEKRRSMFFLQFLCEGRDQEGQLVARARSLFVVKEAP
jgi:hypothetical protein